MKKNAMLKIAAILMVAVLLTTCAISSTFAKYVTAGVTVESNTATVAKWNLKIEAASENPDLFLETYEDGNDKEIAASATGTNLLVAPGLENGSEAFGIKVSGAPEVAYILKADIDVELTNWMVPAAGSDTETVFYCPVVFTVKNSAGTTLATVKQDTSNTDVDKLEKALEDAIAAAIFGSAVVGTADDTGYTYSKVYAPNVDLSSAEMNAGDFQLSWAWAFDVEDDDTSTGVDEAAEADRKDTYLGNKHNSTISIAFKVSAEQSAEGAAN